MNPLLKRTAVVAATSIALGACATILDIRDLEVGSQDGGLDGRDATDDRGSQPKDSGGNEDATPLIDSASQDAPCVVQTSAPKAPTVVAISGGGNGWSSPDAVKAEDDLGAVASGCCSGDDSQLLTARSFAFSVPGDAEIRGVKLEIRLKQASGPTDWMSDVSVKLTPNGTVLGDEMKNATPYTATYETRSYGGPTSLWGVALTPSAVNSADFGIVFRTGHRQNAVATAEVDVIRLTVTYCR